MGVEELNTWQWSAGALSLNMQGIGQSNLSLNGRECVP